MSLAPRIKVLIADDVPEARDNVQKLLQFAPDIVVVGQASTGREALDLARKLGPDIVLMDVTMPDMDGISATQQITAQLPGIAVIVISVQVDSDNLRRSLQAGARDYLAKPFSLDDLTGAIRGVYQSLLATRAQLGAMPASGVTGTGDVSTGKQAKVIAIFSPKGGLGRTTLITNLAVSTKLALDQRVALIDGNIPFGDVGVALNLTSTKTLADLAAQASLLDADMVSDVLVNHSSGLKVLLAPPSPQDAESITGDQVRAILAQMRSSFDYIFVDTRSSFDETQLALLDAAQQIIVLLTMEMTAVKAAKQYLEVAELLGYPSDRTLLVLNRAGGNSQITVEDVEGHLKGKVKARIPDEPTALIQSVNEGVPLVASTPGSRYSVAVMHLASIVTDGAIESEAEPEQRGGLGRFFRRSINQPSSRPALIET